MNQIILYVFVLWSTSFVLVVLHPVFLLPDRPSCFGQVFSTDLVDDMRWTKPATNWNPTVVQTLGGRRKQGKQAIRWEDDINKFMKRLQHRKSRVTSPAT